jgi:SAM-dependent methyltransferase
MIENREHWNKIYSEKSPREVSWYQQTPEVSLSLIDEVHGASSHVIDIGGGASSLVDCLLERDGINVSVLDIAATAFEHTIKRLGDRASEVRFVEADVTNPIEQIEVNSIDVWHDRAVFHFLTTDEQRLGYVQNIKRIVNPDGSIIIATFALDGPEQCSGLDVCRYDAASLQATFEDCGFQLELKKELRAQHLTPWGSSQKFTFALFSTK